ncbi:hypothetical protein [Glutamicibacter arilaitensis]|uniref:hypothetical protein n=1 Tax=Glutamicibacter arilaitensis TaxID=256701 RepID=UPI003FD4AF3D
MTNPTPLNPDALEAAAKSLDVNYNPEQWPVMASMMRDYAEAAVSAYLAVAQPVVNSMEELEALPVGSVILSESYQYSLTVPNYPVVFQKLYTQEWHRGGRLADTHPEIIIPARVIYQPEVDDA